MTTISSFASALPCRYVADCAGAQIYVYAHGVTTVVRVEGEIDAANADRIGDAMPAFHGCGRR